MLQKAKNLYHFAQAFLSALYFNFPSKNLVIIGVTGTDGKTTTVSMIYHILKSAGEKVSMVSSVNAKIGARQIETGLHVTTPSPYQIQKLLRQAVNAGSKYFVLEATSHGLDQNRLAFINFEIGVITNVTEEHLDYHKTWDKYLEAKAKLLQNSKISVINSDDKSFRYLIKISSSKFTTYGKKPNADINLKNFQINLSILGDYNLSNALAASAATNALSIPKRKILKALAAFENPEGRMDEIKTKKDFRIFVDFAHTPNSLENALKSLRKEITKNSKLISVFGCAGNRDKSKRPKMGKVSAKFSDITIITAEDPRNEKVKDISDQIASALKSEGKQENIDYFLIPDRKEAISFAISIAKKGDIIGIFGKGHEKSMAFEKNEIAWSDKSTVTEILKNEK